MIRGYGAMGGEQQFVEISKPKRSQPTLSSPPLIDILTGMEWPEGLHPVF